MQEKVQHHGGPQAAAREWEVQAQPQAGAPRHRALPGQEMTTGDAGAKKPPTCYEKPRGGALFAAQVQQELLTAGQHGCQQLMDGYGALLEPGSILPGSVPSREAGPALPCTQHLPPPKDGPRAQLPLGLAQNHPALEAASCQQRFSHTRTHILLQTSFSLLSLSLVDWGN